MAIETFSWPIRVYYEETDAGGIVYHANYLKFFERARTEWLRALGYELDVMAADGLMFVVTRSELDYLKAAKLNESLEVRSTLHASRRVSFTFEQQLFRGEECLVRGLIKVASVHPETLKPIRLPKNLLEEMGSVS